jgi:hypothetical protein
VPAGLGVRFEQDSDESLGTLVLDVYASDGTTVLGSDTSGNDAEVVDVSASIAGGQTIYALVEGLETRSANQYSLVVSFELPVPDAGSVTDGGEADGGDQVDAGSDDGGVAEDAGLVDAGDEDAGHADAGLLPDGGTR